MLLLDILRSRTRIDFRTVVALLTLAAISTTMVLVVVNLASQQAQDGEVSARLMSLMAVSLIAFIWAQHKSDVLVSSEVERALHHFRLTLFDRVRTSGPQVLEAVGQGPVQGAMTQEMQTISNALPMLMGGVQQLLLIVFVSLYLAWLSLFAFVIVGLLAILAVGIHLHRVHRINSATRAAVDDEGKLFGGLSDLLEGFKEVKMNSLRRDVLLAQLHERSEQARDTKSAIKSQWSRETASIQLAFYFMMAAMVFIVPNFTTDYHDVAVQTATATLFLLGPIGSAIMAVPSFNDTEAAFSRIIELENRLGDALEKQRARESESAAARGGASGSPENHSEDISEIALENVCFTYPGPTGGFGVGPLNARFRRGEITFITGGNGAGKSTIIALLTGLRAVDSGEITVNGHAVSLEGLQSYRDQFATVLSGYHLFSELYGIDPIDPERVDALIRQMEIEHKVALEGNAFSTTSLSQGQKKRLGLIVALLEEKPILVLDEWAADQDPHFRSVFYEQILPSLRDQGKILICVTHDDRWFHVADRIYHVRDGQFEEVRE